MAVRLAITCTNQNHQTDAARVIQLEDGSEHDLLLQREKEDERDVLQTPWSNPGNLPKHTLPKARGTCALPNTPNVPNAQTKIAYSFGTGFSSRIFNCSHRRFRHQFKRRERYSGIHLPLRKSPNAHQDWDPFVGCTTHLVQFVLCRLGRN
jgi:hypothetical protein